MTESRKLLADYARNGSEAAFRELVNRYVDLVYSTALRLVGGDTHQAEDVAQTVFVDLARAAGTLSDEVKLGGWLHRHACFAAAKTMRGERRRQFRERQAVEMDALQADSGEHFSSIAPLLDEAINELGEADRTAILVRFFEQGDFRSVGEALGRNEDAARMRVNRALEKLAALLKRQGVTASAAALGVALSGNAVHAAPPGLAHTICSTAAITGTTIGATATQAITMTTLQKAIIGATLALAVGTGVYEAHQAAGLREQNQLLGRQQTALTEQIQQLQRERDEAQSRLAADSGRGDAGQPAAELLKLRGEVSQLRRQLAQLSGAAGGTDDPFTRSVLGLAARAAELNQHLEQMPERKIPELQFLVENDWLNAARGAKFDTEADVRKALRRLRNYAKNKMPMGGALHRFIAANNGQLPTDISQLKPYFKTSAENDPDWNWSNVDPARHGAILDAILDRYKLVHTGSVSNLPPNTWLVIEKAPVDKDYDSRAKFGAGCSSIMDTGLGEAGDPDDKSY